MNVLSLFDGISCGQLALERAGIKVTNYFASEVEKESIKVTQSNYPNTIQLGNVCNIDYSLLPKIDLLIGGSPCQSFSRIGDNKGFEGKSGLFWEYVKALKIVKPTYFLLENVIMKPEYENVITKALGVKPIRINSNLVSAQNRDRLYWTNIPYLHPPKDKKIMFKDVLEEKPFRPIPNCFNTKWGKEKRINKGLNWIGNAKANCLTTKNCHPYQYLLNQSKDLCRLLTVNEYELLQTLPLNYTKGVSNTARFKAIGNSWTIDVIAHIFRHINNPTKKINQINSIQKEYKQLVISL